MPSDSEPIRQLLAARKVKEEEADLSPPEVLFEDSSPLSDVATGPGGEICYTRRAPSRADVIVQTDPLGPRETWLKGFSGNLQLFGLDDHQCFANTGRELLRIERDRSSCIHRAADEIDGASFHPVNRRLLWIEGRRTRKAFVAELAARLSPERVAARGTPFRIVPAGPDAVMLQTSVRARGHEDRTAFSLHSASGRSARPLFTTYRSVPYVAGCPEAAFCAVFSPCFIASDDREASLRAAEEDPAAPPGATSGVWILRLSPADNVTAVCVSNRSPRTDPLLVGDRVIFASPGDRGGSVLVVAGERGARMALTNDYIRDFAVLPRIPAIVYGKDAQRSRPVAVTAPATACRVTGLA